MTLKSGLFFHWLLFIYFTCSVIDTANSLVEIGSCSQTCQDRESTATDTNSLHPKYCSCSSSCYLYRDCCHNSPYRKPGRSASVTTMCISISDIADYKVVAQCASNWTGSPNSCKDSIGRLHPVTSTATGISYANIRCAECNADAQQLVTWNVELKCCEEHDNVENQAHRNFTYSRGTLYSVSSGRNCACQYNIPEEDTSLSGLELRTCDTRNEISRCPYTWTDISVRDNCYSFIEPVYSSDKVYRNTYCAECNYQRADMIHCEPPIVKEMLGNGANLTAIFSHCVTHNNRDCLHFFQNLNVGRGNPYVFHDVVSIHETQCIPPNGKRCCDGEKFDKKSKKCRALHVE